MADEHIEIELDDEDRPPPVAPPPAPGHIEITSEELRRMPDPPAPRPFYPGPMVAGPGGYVPATKAGPAVSGRAILPMAIAGLVGGILAWLGAEAMVGFDAGAANPVAVIASMGFFGALMGGIIGACLGAAEGLSNGVAQKAFSAGLVGLGIGAGGGFLGGAIGQFFFGTLLHAGGMGGGEVSSVMLARVVGWSLVGVFIGMGQGIGRGSGRRVVNGVLGGLIGGFIAGVLFDPIAMMVPQRPGDTGTASRAVGITILGLAAGVAIGLVDQIRKEAWLSVTGGPLAGKQFILFEQRTRIGSSPKCEITLFKDPGILPEHAAIEERGVERILLAANPGAPPLLNGHPASGARLTSGSIITLGSTTLLYEEKPPIR